MVTKGVLSECAMSVENTITMTAMSDSRDPRKALLVAYSFPPVGGAGVQRMSKLAKYLGMHGFTPQVLTSANPSVPLTDDSLARDLPADLEVIRARSLEPGYAAKKAAWEAAADVKPSRSKQMVRFATGFVRQLAFPDIQVLWLPGAQVALAKLLLQRNAPDVVLISGPPFSQFLLAPIARSRAAVVLDYRDEWSLIRGEYEMTRSTVAKYVGDPLEAALLRAAHMVTTATEEFRQNLLDRFTFLDPTSVVAIPNGFDPDDFPKELPSPPTDRYVLSHVGTVFRLTSPVGLLGAIRRLHEKEPELAKLLEVRFVGRIVDLENAAFEGMEQLGVKRVGYLAHDEALRALAASHMVLCILDDAPGVERIYPAKIFEAMYLGRPCLTLAPDGALSRLVERYKIGYRLRPRDEAAICELLAQKLRAFRDGARGATIEAGAGGIERFDRRVTAGSFADVMRDAMARKGTARPGEGMKVVPQSKGENAHL
jgi:glycosyltransferase involved in cell wall biosynthesis